MNKIQFGKDDNIANPCFDSVFKAVFTRNTKNSKTALEKLISAIIGKNVTHTQVFENEPPINDLRDRQIRYDIAVKFNNGELANVEMTITPKTFETARLEYYASKLFTRQDIKGDDNYGNLKHTYQITIAVERPIFKDDDFIHCFKYHDKEKNLPLGGLSSIITVELSKVEKLMKKPIEEMDSKERWAIFFKYGDDKGKRDIMNYLAASSEVSDFSRKICRWQGNY
jgi:predicted transposase/invertase (TIGR01784 family)